MVSGVHEPGSGAEHASRRPTAFLTIGISNWHRVGFLMMCMCRQLRRDWLFSRPSLVLLIDPLTGRPFPDGVIPVSRIGLPAALRICDNCAVEDVVPEPNTFGILGSALSALGLCMQESVSDDAILLGALRTL